MTRVICRSLPDAELFAYEKQLSQRVIPQHATGMVGDLKLDQLPGLDALAVPGTREGEHKMVRNGNTAELHHWDSVGQRWVKVSKLQKEFRCNSLILTRVIVR